jgi:hypothetical protein
VRLAPVIFTLAACCAPAHSANPDDAGRLVRQSIENGERSWKASTGYACTKRVVERTFDSVGEVKTTSEDTYSIIPLGYGASFDEHIQHDNEPVPAAIRERDSKELEKLRAESPAQKQRIFEKALAERSYMKEVPDAFNFRITGEEQLPTGPAWVVEATPRPGFIPMSRYAHVFPKMRGTLWIDKKNLQWVKADAVATDNISFGLFIARLAKGSHILLGQKRLPDGDWVPASLEARAEATTFLFFQHNFEQMITYNNYSKLGPLQAAR